MIWRSLTDVHKAFGGQQVSAAYAEGGEGEMLRHIIGGWLGGTGQSVCLKFVFS